MDEIESMREIYDFPEELDFCSDSFDPEVALKSYIHLPYPNAKTYNNLAEYYSHTFLKKDVLKRIEKDRPYDRDYSYYYATLGLDRRAQERYERRRVDRIKRMKYAGWRTAKLRKKLPKLDDDPNREPCRSYPPLQSTKIIQTNSALRKYKIFLITKSLDYYDETNIDKQFNNFVENEAKEDKNPSTQNGKKTSGHSNITPGQEMCPQNSLQCEPSSLKPLDHSFSKDSKHQQKIVENSSSNFRRKNQQPPNSNQFRQSKNSHSIKVSQPENRDPRLKKKRVS